MVKLNCLHMNSVFYCNIILFEILNFNTEKDANFGKTFLKSHQSELQ